MPSKCVFCGIVSGRMASHIVWEDSEFLAILDFNPLKPGHTLLIPKKHVEYVFDLPEPLYSKLFQTVKQVAAIVKKNSNAKRIGISIEGFLVPHICIHLVPINKENELLPKRSHAIDEQGGTTIFRR